MANAKAPVTEQAQAPTELKVEFKTEAKAETKTEPEALQPAAVATPAQPATDPLAAIMELSEDERIALFT